MFFSQSVDEGSMSVHQNLMMENVIAMKSLPVAQIMTPISEIPRISQNATIAELKAVLTNSKHSRAVVYKEQTNRVSGTVHIFDLINANAKEDDLIAKYVQNAIHIHPSVSVQEAFTKLRNHKHPVAFVGNNKQSFGQIRLYDIAQYISQRA